MLQSSRTRSQREKTTRAAAAAERFQRCGFSGEMASLETTQSQARRQTLRRLPNIRTASQAAEQTNRARKKHTSGAKARTRFTRFKGTSKLVPFPRPASIRVLP